MQIIVAQIAPALVLTAIFVLAAQGTLATASDAAGYLVIGVAMATGFLGIVSQYAAIREAGSLVIDMGNLKDSTALTKKIASSSSFLSLTAIVVGVLGLFMFALVVLVVMG